jgi:DNA-directed RNA polymerase subunit RPC12/RpoP
MNFVNIRAYDNYIYANMKYALLQENGINCHLKDEFTVTIDPLLNPAIGGIKLMVAEPQAERALQILNDVDLEWLQTVPCPACGQKTLHKEVLIKEFPGFWGKIKSMLANGEEREVRTVYICGNCHNEFKALEIEE